MPAWRWLIIHLMTRAHFMRGIATFILVVGAYQSIRLGKIDETWLALIGMVVGHYFRGGEDDRRCK